MDSLEFGQDGSSPVSFSLARRAMKGITVLESELDTIANITVSENFGYMGIAIGAALALGITLATVDDLKGKPLAAFWGAFIFSVALSWVLWRLAERDKKRALAKVNELKGLMTDLVVSQKS